MKNSIIKNINFSYIFLQIIHFLIINNLFLSLFCDKKETLFFLKIKLVFLGMIEFLYE